MSRGSRIARFRARLPWLARLASRMQIKLAYGRFHHRRPRDCLFLYRPSALLSSIMRFTIIPSMQAPHDWGNRFGAADSHATGASGRRSSSDSHPGFEEHSMAHKPGGITGGTPEEQSGTIRRDPAGVFTLSQLLSGLEKRAEALRAVPATGGELGDERTAATAVGWLQGMLEQDRHTPRKQRHTAVRSSGFPVKTASWYRCVLELSPPPSLFDFPGGVRLDVEAP